VFRLAILGTVVVAVAAPVALANQAGHKIGTYEDGSRATIVGSASVGSYSGVIAAVRIQENDTDPHAGMFQFGEISESSTVSTDCGRGTIGYFIEYAPSGGQLTCNIYLGGFGTQHKFSVLRASNGSGFSAYLDGNYFAGPWALGFPSLGKAYAVAEYNGCCNPPTSYDFVWGPTGGTTPWQRTSDYGATWTTVSSGDTTFNGGGWTVQGVPSPFHIYR
jgi:hypothetical protein